MDSWAQAHEHQVTGQRHGSANGGAHAETADAMQLRRWTEQQAGEIYLMCDDDLIEKERNLRAYRRWAEANPIAADWARLRRRAELTEDLLGDEICRRVWLWELLPFEVV